MEKQIEVKKDLTPAEMIMQGVQQNTDLSKLEKLLELQERWEANQARKEFSANFANVQKEIQAVVKKAINPQTHSKYANLDDIIDAVKPIYTNYGFSIIFYEGKTEYPEHIRICADVMHNLGHKETYYYDVPLDGVGIKGNANMTKIHAKASSTSYGRRYLMCMIWNIPTSDDDGNAASKPIEFIDEKQISQITDYLSEIGTENTPKFLKYLGVEKIENISKSDFPKVLASLKSALDKKKGKK